MREVFKVIKSRRVLATILSVAIIAGCSFSSTPQPTTLDHAGLALAGVPTPGLTPGPDNWPPPPSPPDTVTGWSYLGWTTTLTSQVSGYVRVSHHPSLTIQLVQVAQLRLDNAIVASQTFTPGIYAPTEIGTGDFATLSWTWQSNIAGREFTCDYWSLPDGGRVYTIVELAGDDLSWRGEDGCSPTGRWIWKLRFLPLILRR